MFDNFVQDCENENRDCRVVDKVHGFEVEARGPIRVFFSKEVHITKLGCAVRKNNNTPNYYKRVRKNSDASGLL